MSDGAPGTARRWRIHPESPLGQPTALALNLGSGVAAGALFIAVAPASSWNRPVLLAALAALAVVAFLAEARLKTSAAAYFDASLVVALLALAIAGPLPALLIWALPDFASRFVLRRDPMFSPGMVATLA